MHLINLPHTLNEASKRALPKPPLSFTKTNFHFYPTDLVNTQKSLPLGVGIWRLGILSINIYLPFGEQLYSTCPCYSNVR